MKSLFILSAILFSISGIAQTAKSFYFNGNTIQASGVFVEKHPYQNAYFSAAEKTHSSFTTGTYSETVLSKVDAGGNTEWHTSIQHPEYAYNLSGLCDIKVNTSHVFVSTLITTAGVSKVHVYKLDLDGALLDSAILTGSSPLAMAKSEMDFDGDGNLFTLIQQTDDHILFCKINPTTMDVISTADIGIGSNPNNLATRTLFAEFDGMDAVIGYNISGSAHLLRINNAGTITDNFTIPTPDGEMTDFTFQNWTYNLLINKHFISSTPADNPLRIVKINYAGTVLSNTAIPVQNAVLFDNLVIDTDETIYVAARQQQSAINGTGALLKVSAGVLVYEHPLAKTNLNEIELNGSHFFSSGSQINQVTDCSQSAEGNALVVHKKSVIPSFQMVGPQMRFEANNISAIISYNSTNFNDLGATSHGYEIDGAGNTIYTSSLLIAGEDINSSIKSSCQIFGNMYAAGPVTDDAAYTSLERDKWERVWIVSRTQIDAHIAAFMAGDGAYVMPESIRNWPGNGDVSKGQSADVARYQDLNGNGIYEPTQGEYPIIKGDYCALSVYNDVNAGFFESCNDFGSEAGVEVHEYVYGFDCPQDSALQNSLFVYYEIIRKSTVTLYNTYIGSYVDYDINSSSNDFLSSDVMRSIFYGRNGDGTGPEQAYLILGSTQDEDGLDNASGIGAGESPNGYGYGDGIIDNERLGMTNFLYFNNAGGANGMPSIQTDYYRYMQSIWQNSAPMLYGGNGYNTGTTTIESSFMFQGDSDPLWYSTNGIDPGFSWTEESAGNAPSDRRGMASSGPFNYHWGDTLYFDIALVDGMENITAGYTSNEALLANVDSARNYFAANETTCGQSFDFYAPFNGVYPYLELPEKAVATPSLFPNPTNGNVTIQGLPENTTLSVYATSGQLISSDLITKGSVTYDYNELPRGIYFVTIQSEAYTGTIKFVKQ